MRRLLDPKLRLRVAVVLLVASIVGWPLTALTWASNEEQFILGLSWLAIILTAADIASTTDVRQEQAS